MEIEETMFQEFLPVNSLAMLNRLKDILKEKGTNCLTEIAKDVRVRQVLWLLISQVYTSKFSERLTEEYIELKKLNSK